MASRALPHSTPSRKRHFSLHRRLTGRFWWDRPHPLFFDRRIHGHSPQPLGSPCDAEPTPKPGRPASLNSTPFRAFFAGRRRLAATLAHSHCDRVRTRPAQWVKYASTNRSRNRSPKRARRQLPFEGPGISVLPDLSPVARDYPEVWVFETQIRYRGSFSASTQKPQDNPG